MLSQLLEFHYQNKWWKSGKRRRLSKEIQVIFDIINGEVEPKGPLKIEGGDFKSFASALFASSQ
jgi:hypothetical protein